MEFIDGPNLRSIAKRAGELGELLPVAEVVRVIAQAAGGLHYAHELCDPVSGQPLGLVHRDISPDNVLVHKNGSVKVVDFGIAKAANSSGVTRTGTLKGKVAYMPPEQLRGEPLDRRVDVFALGVVMYELLAQAPLGRHLRGRAHQPDHDHRSAAAGRAAARRAAEALRRHRARALQGSRPAATRPATSCSRTWSRP